LNLATDYNCVLGFVPPRQDFEIILNESSNSTEYANIEWLRKETIRYFTTKQGIRGFLGFKSSFQNCIWNFLAPLVRLKSVKQEMFGNFQVDSQGIL
jgi:hypothetical protein